MHSAKILLFIFGTRPEAIKMAPLIKKFEENKNFKVVICVTGQHSEMLQQVLDFFNIKPDFDLEIMSPNQDSLDIITLSIQGLKPIIAAVKPHLIFVQGDTTTALAAAQAAFYSKFKVVHIEAGLRTGNIESPFPEEMNRVLIGKLAHYHFCPSVQAQENLQLEGITNNIFMVGNTVVDALLLTLDIIHKDDQVYKNYFGFLNFEKKIILITCHRRETFGKPLQNIIKALQILAANYPNCQFVYALHPNPNIQNVLRDSLSDISNIYLLNPLTYPQMIWLMQKSYFIITDSGGLQEEAPTLKKPLLIIRDVTERGEVIALGGAKLIGTSLEKVIMEVSNLIDNEKRYNNMILEHNPYGTGKSCDDIMCIIESNFII